MAYGIVSILATLTLLTSPSSSAPPRSDLPNSAPAPASAIISFHASAARLGSAQTADSVLRRQEDGWAAALVKRDRAYFEQMLADRFVYTEDDRLMTRADVLRDATSGSDRPTAAHNEDMVVHLFGNTGVVTGRLIVSGTGKAGKFDHHYRFTDTWVRQPDGRWQIVAAQDYLIPPK
jgi:ketosteroid isomerase-like protein